MNDLILDGPTRQACDDVVAGRIDPVRLAIVAPGGYGKTALLERLRRHSLVLVDDAHELPDELLAEFRALADDEDTGLVVAARPTPRSAALNDLLGSLRGQLVLRPFDRAQVAACLGRRVGDEVVDFVHEQTGGVPAYVRRLSSIVDTCGIPVDALAEFRHELDLLDRDTLTFLLAAEVGAAGDIDLLRAVLSGDPTTVMAAARSTGLLGSDGRLLPVGGAAVRALIPVEQRTAVRRELAQSQLDRGGPVLDLVEPLVGKGVGGARIADAFEAAAQEAVPTDPALAARLYEAAVAAGGSAVAVGARWAHAAALSGDLDTALRLADQAISSTDPRDRMIGAQVAATALAHRGQLARSAQLHQWSATGQSTPFAVIGLVGTGKLDDARAALTVDGDEPPTLLAGATSAAATGVLESVTCAPAIALSTLVSAAEMLEPVGRAVLLPDSPAALGAIVALHCGEQAVAEPLLERALAAGVGGSTLTARHLLLLGWIAMVRGDLAVARDRRAEAGEDLAPRDWLFAVGLEVGLSRRASDLGALRQIWGQACEAVIRHPVDLFTLLPLGEFAVASARLGDRERLVPHLNQARELLGALGGPTLWSTLLHWNELHAAIIAEHQDEARCHADVLTDQDGPFPALVSAAARCWVEVIAGRVDPDAVQAAAHGLDGAGMCWDGARLAGQAAIRTSDRKAMVGLLDCARALQGRSDTTPTGEPAADRAGCRPAQRARTAGRRAGGRRDDLQAGRRPAVHLGQDGGAPHGQDASADRRHQPQRTARPTAVPGLASPPPPRPRQVGPAARARSARASRSARAAPRHPPPRGRSTVDRRASASRSPRG